jgi:hypothetical protein
VVWEDGGSNPASYPIYISGAANWPAERQSTHLSPLFYEDAQDAQDVQAIN